MSKIGKQLIQVPEGVEVELKNNTIYVRGKLGELQLGISNGIKVEISDKQVVVNRQSEEEKVKSMHGTTRTLIANMINGVTNGFSKTLELRGMGYRVSMEGDVLVLKLGLTHPVKVKPVEGVKFEVEGDTVVHVKGIDKVLVGNVAAKIRNLKKPEPYKGKGIRYKDEIIRRKTPKAVKAE